MKIFKLAMLMNLQEVLKKDLKMRIFFFKSEDMILKVKMINQIINQKIKKNQNNMIN